MAIVWFAHQPFKVKEVPGAIRTPDLQLRRLTLYPAELQAHKDFRSEIGANVYVLKYFNRFNIFCQVFNKKIQGGVE